MPIKPNPVEDFLSGIDKVTSALEGSDEKLADIIGDEEEEEEEEDE